MKFKSQLLWALFFSLIFFTTSGFTVVGHRGDPIKYPEETIQADNSAFNSGADYVELDLQLSKDGVLVISHDDDLYRVTHTHAIVSQNNFETLKQLRYDNGEHVMSLNELFAHYKNKPNTKFVLETKIDHSINPSYELEDKIAEVVKEYHMQNRIMIHSFSAASLFHLRKVMPDAYLILIVGSLKRINFSILPQVNAVNASSDIVQEHPFLIHWLHKLHKQLFVWAEMDESPALWHWLINRNVDGVVTNFPATGFKYKLAKSGTKKYAINRQGIYFGKTKTATMMNPYVRIKEKKYVYPGQKLDVTYGVRVDDHLYYQIAEKTFISAEFVNLDLKPQDIAPYQQKRIIAKPNSKVTIYSYPDNQARTTKTLPANKLFKIQNFNGSPKNMWIYTKLGWVKAKSILFYGFFNSKDFTKYDQLPRVSQYTNLVLLPYNPNQLVNEPTYAEKQKQINHIVY
ncbi:glycerophosphodiester phosphodiesterase [Lactobacillus ultunensis]|uniref:Glycerophosphodiester phosphodiesterase family protein n=1 Tax=Lactobacillus ultunensis DSM 16047 TaxID=525365 RepID=C2ERA5_9LACO|nr:glycerophosphodiester phosphodiesterase [Lactobacillus ultunensis]EEJ70938.1 glycerophosphodiester phosphodiesterase family protein [Lactobacillus ultunensis DSM 16047]KRL80445.1 glycerophosphoryl diester phosphodiesterase [Lactobacillus ultunensis DSM 16047]QQP29014.1 glycerophosphodiester phosphodiesterase [Lactobacillus ultunensis]